MQERKNMRQLIYFELKKILGRRANQVAMLLGLLLVVICSVAQIQGETLNDNGKEWKGADAILRQQEIENALADQLDEEFLTDFLREYQRQIAGNPSGYDFSLIRPNRNLFALIAKNYVEWNEYLDYETLSGIPTEDGIGFYDRRMEKIETLLNAEYTYGNYTEAEKQYWLEKAGAVNTPFQWGGKDVWDIIWTGIGLLFYQFLVVGLCIAPVFAGECQNRTDALLLTTKYGKNRAISAKLLVSFAFSFLYIALCGLISVGINMALLGTKGWDLPIQLWDTLFPYEWTVAQACIINLCVIILIALLLTAFSLMLSAVSKSPVIVLAVDVLLFFGTAFLPFSKNSGVWNKIVRLVPMNCCSLKNVLKSYNDYPFGNLIISYLGMIFLVYIFLMVICTLCAGKGFQRYRGSDN